MQPKVVVFGHLVWRRTMAKIFLEKVNPDTTKKINSYQFNITSLFLLKIIGIISAVLPLSKIEKLSIIIKKLSIIILKIYPPP